MDTQTCEEHNMKLLAKFQEMEKNECRYEEIMTDDAEFIIVSYGTTARISISAAEKLRASGIKVGILRPITLWPFPSKPLLALAEKPEVKAFLSVEMSTGQMVDDVRLAVCGKKPVDFYGRTGGMMPSVSEIEKKIKEMAGKTTEVAR